MTFRTVGQDQPWTLPGPSGAVSVLGVVFAGAEAVLDNGALHARSHLELGVRFSDDLTRRGRGERLLYAWVTHPGAVAEQFLGVSTSEAWIERAAGTGYKRHLDHVNRMSAAVRGEVDVSALSVEQRSSLGRLLATYAPRAWERTAEPFRLALSA